MTKPLRLGAYLLTALLLASYVVVMWWMIHPTVPQTYRAYYIDQTTTCMDQPVSGAYTLGTMVSYLPDSGDIAKPTKPCGWEGPVGDGTHAVGTSARLRFVYTQPVAGPLTFAFDMVAIKKANQPMPQSVEITANGQHVATVKVADTDPTAPQHFTVPLPADLVAAANGKIDLLFDFPDAVNMGLTDPQTRWRSVKLISAGLLPAA